MHVAASGTESKMIQNLKEGKIHEDSESWKRYHRRARFCMIGADYPSRKKMGWMMVMTQAR